MSRQDEWLLAFADELRRVSAGALNHQNQLLRSVGLQQWAVLADENPTIVARRWATRSGLNCESTRPRPPTMLIWLSECSEELQRQQPTLGPHVANALALLQWDLHGDLDPVGAALNWIASRPIGWVSQNEATSLD